MPVSIDDVRAEIARRSEPDGDSGWAWVREMFTDRAIVEIELRDEPGLQLVEVSWQLDDDAEDVEALELGDPVEVSLEYVAKAEGGPRLAGPIVRKDAAQQIAYSAVLVPGEPDSDDEVLTAEKVEEVAHTWLEQFRAFDLQHSVKQIAASPVESYIEPADRTVQIDGEDVVLPQGTWTVAVKFRDDEAWEQVATGDKAGLSIMGVPNDQMDVALAAVKSGDQPALKRVTLADVGGGDSNGDWFAPFIGVVDQPAVPKAKFYAMKAAPEEAPASPGRRLWDALTGAGKGGRKVSDARYDKAKQAYDLLGEIIAEAEEERADKAHDQKEITVDRDEVVTIVSEAVPGAVKSAIGDVLEEALKPITDRLDKIDPPDGGENTDEEAVVEVPEAVKSAIESAVQPLVDKLDRVEKRTRAGSDQLDDEDDAPASVKSVGRDAFGRRFDA